MDVTATAAWQQLAGLAPEKAALDVAAAFAADERRFARFSFEAPHVLADLSKQRIDDEVLQALLALARERRVDELRDAMLAGEPINVTEGRAVLHTALRAPLHTGPYADEVHEELEAFLRFADEVRGDGAITDVVNIGIGGSDLGPRMATEALAPFAAPHLRTHFVSNVDGFDLAATLQHLRPASTLFVIVSKTFTTAETIANARAAKAWFEAAGGTDVAAHFVGVTTNLQAAAAFGIERTFGFWDWVGGRYSVWSAVGLSLAIAIGADGFRSFLTGARAMDEHFAQAPDAGNVPLLLGLLDVWNRNFLGFPSRSVAPYHQGLARFPAYLQQLEMESNGKRVDCAGAPLACASAPVVWGEAGTNGQHAFFQMLHQGTDVVPVDFVVVCEPVLPAQGMAPAVQAQLRGQHRTLVANALAQARALMVGKTAAEAAAEHPPTANPALPAATIARHRTFPGNRPSTTLLVDRLDPEGLGALLALHEHRVFASGAVWGVDSFDQWGVELGKALARDIEPRLASGDAAGLDGSTAGLLARIRG